jgi:hypothetical protein
MWPRTEVDGVRFSVPTFLGFMLATARPSARHSTVTSPRSAWMPSVCGRDGRRELMCTVKVRTSRKLPCPIARSKYETQQGTAACQGR